MKNVNAPRPVIIAVLTLVTVVFWIIFGIIRIIVKPEEVNVPNEVLEPLNPTLDTNILSELENRIFLSDEAIGETQIAASPTPEALEATPAEEQPSPTPIPESPSPSPIEEPIEEI